MTLFRQIFPHVSNSTFSFSKLSFFLLSFSLASLSLAQDKISWEIKPLFDTIYRNEPVTIIFSQKNHSDKFDPIPSITDSSDFRKLEFFSQINPKTGLFFTFCQLTPQHPGFLEFPEFIFQDKKNSNNYSIKTKKGVYCVNSKASNNELEKRLNYKYYLWDSIRQQRDSFLAATKDFLLDSIKKCNCGEKNIYLRTSNDTFTIHNKNNAGIIEFETNCYFFYPRPKNGSYAETGSQKQDGTCSLSCTTVISAGKPPGFAFPVAKNIKTATVYSTTCTQTFCYQNYYQTEESVAPDILSCCSIISKLELSMSFKKKGIFTFEPASLQYNNKLITSNAFTVIVK